MLERQNRTIICSVLFLDVVEYSRKPVSEQMRLRERFNLHLRAALKGVASNDRVILDTGDGAAVTFLGDPEDALFMALTLRDSLAAEQAEEEPRLRLGINLGPVKLVKDINGRPNIIGDGINVAQRVMGFAKPGQVLVSRSYYEVVSRLSDDYSRLFNYEGARTDKHVREHEVYAVSSELPIPARTSDSSRYRRLAGAWRGAVFLVQAAESVERVARNLLAKPRLATVVAVVAIVSLGAAARGSRDLSAASVAQHDKAEPLPIAFVPVPAPAPAPAESAPAQPLAVDAKAPPATPEANAGNGAKKLPAPESTKKVAAAKPARAAAPKESQGDGLVAVALAVLPWGEVYVDGRSQGVSPPVRSIQLAPGKHEIEFRNTTFPSHSQTIEVKPGEPPLTVRHKFQVGESR